MFQPPGGAVSGIINSEGINLFGQTSKDQCVHRYPLLSAFVLSLGIMIEQKSCVQRLMLLTHISFMVFQCVMTQYLQRNKLVWTNPWQTNSSTGVHQCASMITIL